MITSRRPPRTRELLALALILSVLVHFFGGYVLTRFSRTIGAVLQEKTPPGEVPLVTDLIELEPPMRRPTVKRAPPPAVRRSQPEHKAAPVVLQLPRPAVLAPPPTAPKRAISQPSTRPELAHITVHAPAQQSRSRGAGTPQTSSRSTLSSEQIAQMESKFAKTIAESRTDVATITQQVQDAPAQPKHYSMQFNGIHSDLRHGEGYIRPIAPARRVGNFVYYFTHYEYMYADGHVEQDDIPWEFMFPIRDDPFAHGFFGQKIRLQAPPPGFRPNRQLQPILMQFFGGPEVPP